MKYLVLLLALTGCTAKDSPEALNYRDQISANCKKACAPREMKSFETFFGCRCVDDKK